MKSFLITITLSTTLLTSTAMITSHFTTKTNTVTNQIYVLGDSLSDNGNLANILTHDTWGIDKVNFKAPFYHNSFSNGDVAASVLAQNLGITLTPGWYKQGGNNYAVGGAQAGQNSSIEYKTFLNHYAIDHQADQLLEDHKLQKNDDIFIEIGGNDLLSAMDEKTPSDQDNTISNAITTEVNTIKKLINAGAQNLIIANVPNISKIPKYVNETATIKSLAEALSNKFNTKWSFNINNLIKANPKVNIKPFNLEENFNNLLNKGEKMGKNITNASIKWTIKEIILNKKPEYINGTTAETINNNFFFDYVHPNKWAHKQIGIALFNLINS